MIWRKAGIILFIALCSCEINGRGYNLTQLTEDSFEVSFPSSFTSKFQVNDTVYGILFKPASLERNKKYPVLVFVHYTSSYLTPIERFCRTIAKKNVVTFLIYLPYYGKRRPFDLNRKELLGDPQSIADFFDQAIQDTLKAKEFLSRLEYVDKQKISVSGVSLGGIVALSAGAVGGFYKCVPIAAGGDVAGVIYNPSFETYRYRVLLEKNGVTIDELREKLRHIDPLTHANKFDPGRVFLIYMMFDEVFPLSFALKTYNKTGRPKTAWLPGSHYMLALYWRSIQRFLINFILN